MKGNLEVTLRVCPRRFFGDLYVTYIHPEPYTAELLARITVAWKSMWGFQKLGASVMRVPVVRFALLAASKKWKCMCAEFCFLFLNSQIRGAWGAWGDLRDSRAQSPPLEDPKITVAQKLPQS